MFPIVKKSRVNENGIYRVAVKGIKLGFIEYTEDEIIQENTFDLSTIVPQEWMILEHNSSVAKFCKYSSDELFNGNPVQTQLIIDKTSGSLQVVVAGKNVELSEYFIGSKLVFNRRSLTCLLRSLKILTLCKGFEPNHSDHDDFTKSKKAYSAVKETETVIRHTECKRVVSLTSQTKICATCSTFRKQRKSYCSRLSFSEKENENPSYSQQPGDVTKQLRKIAPQLNDNQLNLIASQIKASELKSSKGMRWSKEVVSMTLTLYNRNPAAYRDLTQNGWLNLPSESLLYLYKSAVKQRPRIISDMMLWMFNEAKRQNIPKEGFYGGIVLDEMAIQDDLQIVRQGQDSTFVGLVECEPEIEIIHNISQSGCSSNTKLADHVMQYVFNGISGFRWPFANYPNTQAAPADIFVTTWRCIDALYEWNFKPIYCCMDGSSNNRAFLKMHFQECDILSTNMVASHYKNPKRKLIFMMDPCHLIKQIRNSVLSSGLNENHQRLLTVDDYTITWQMFIDAYQWDRSSHSFPIHHKLTDEHLFPNSAHKMRNKLAFEVLNSDMLHLMKSYQNFLTSAAGQKSLTSVIQFLEHTSVLVSVFTDVRPLKDLGDERLKNLSTCHNWFKSWERHICQSETKSKRYKELITMETREDLDFMYHGFMSLVKMCIDDLHNDLVPARINSDIIENVFCQQRGLYHGATTNPTYNAYRTGINSIVLGQASISRKSNAGASKITAQPFSAERPRKILRF